MNYSHPTAWYVQKCFSFKPTTLAGVLDEAEAATKHEGRGHKESTCMCTHTCVYIYINIYVCMYVCMYVYIYIYICMYIFIYTYMHVCVCDITYAYFSLSLYIYIYIYTCIMHSISTYTCHMCVSCSGYRYDAVKQYLYCSEPITKAVLPRSMGEQRLRLRRPRGRALRRVRAGGPWTDLAYAYMNLFAT